MQVKIRPLQEQDAYTSVRWRNDPEVFKFTGNTYDHEITIDSELAWIRKVMVNYNDYRCAILVDGVYVGNIYLTDINEVSAHYHIFIGNKNYWGKGVAVKASQLILDYAFNELRINTVRLRVRKENTSAVKLYRKLGFKDVGTEDKWIVMEVQKDKI